MDCRQMSPASSLPLIFRVSMGLTFLSGRLGVTECGQDEYGQDNRVAANYTESSSADIFETLRVFREMPL
jgi:hypothetical protein